MIKRYAREPMQDLWTEQAKYDHWLKVEIAAVRAWCKLGLIPREDKDRIVENANFDLDDIQNIEKKTKHDVIAFLSSVAQTLGSESRWVHFGMTSSDTIDTALNLQIKSSLEIIIKDLDRILELLKDKALIHQNTLTIGRSHGIHGEPISFSLVMANWYAEIKRHLEAIHSVKENIAVGKMSGAMGNFAHAPLEFEELVCEYLDLKPDLISSQVISRDRYAAVFSTLALLASSIEKFAVNIRHWQRTEVYEAEEYFAKGQKGSSAMPHKRNPVLSENITGLARMIRAYAIPAMENVALWHERDISHSSVERFICPDAFITCDFMLDRFANIIENLLIYPKNMLKNLRQTGGLVFSQRILLELPKKGLSREQSYMIVQENAMMVWQDLQAGKPALDDEGQSLFLNYLLNDLRFKRKT